MSVIENAINKLRASRAGGAAAARHKEYDAATSGGGAADGARSPRRGTLGRLPAPRHQSGCVTRRGAPAAFHQERELAQQFRQIKRPLINNALGRGVAPLPQGNLVMVASAVPGEGKTFTSLNLALSMRLEEDVTVLLVDGDVVNPRITRILGLENEPGLLDVVRDPGVSVGSAILATDVPGLAFLPAGRPDANPTELLASTRMRDVAALLGGHDATRWCCSIPRP